MASPSKVAYADATGDITTDTVFVRGIVLAASTSNATAVLKAGGSGGTTLGTWTALANTSLAVDMHEAQFADGLHVTLSGTGATVTVVHL